LTAGAIALAVITPALDPVEHAAEAVDAVPPIAPARAESAHLGPDAAFRERAIDTQRASRTAVRRAVPVRRTRWVGPTVRSPYRTTILVAARAARLGEWTAARENALLRPGNARQNAEVPSASPSRSGQIRRATRAVRTVQAVRAAVPRRDTVRTVVTKHAMAAHATQRVALGGGMNAVIAYARSQVGKRYVTGGEGRGGFDCSGFTKRAYALAGIRLPHSSGAQAARARSISRTAARPGDLVVGPGHVGIYMGHGMMIDAGNHRTGVVYRKLYSGLRVERL